MKEILVETSAIHIHVTQETLEILCGAGATLKIRKELSQPGQYVSETRLDIVGPKNTIKGVSILGPTRPENQVEVSATDARTLGIPAVVRESGDIKGSAPITLVGPCGSVTLEEGAIVAKRHIHMTTKDAEELGVEDKQIVEVKVQTNGRSLTFGDVVVRVKDSFALAMHIDTDESNAAGCAGVVYGTIVK